MRAFFLRRVVLPCAGSRLHHEANVLAGSAHDVDTGIPGKSAVSRGSSVEPERADASLRYPSPEADSGRAPSSPAISLDRAPRRVFDRAFPDPLARYFSRPNQLNPKLF